MRLKNRIAIITGTAEVAEPRIQNSVAAPDPIDNRIKNDLATSINPDDPSGIWAEYPHAEMGQQRRND